MDAGVLRTRLDAVMRAGGRGSLVAVSALGLGIPLLVLAALALPLCVFGIDRRLPRRVLAPILAFTDLERGWARRWSVVEIPRREGASWQDIGWLTLNIPVGFVCGLLAIYVPLLCVQSLVAVPFLIATGGSVAYWWLAIGLGAAAWLVVPVAGPKLLEGHARFSASLLSPSRRALAARVGALTETRSQLLDSSAAELRRIERDLHDGAQTRLAALGLNIGLAEQLVRENPDAAIALLAEARESSGQALAELRGLVRGIHPPVLAERGLDGALRALALSLPLPVDLDLDVPPELAAPLESALYFAVAETLANVVKHSGATRVAIEVGVRDVGGDAARVLSANVRDDGKGGARILPGGGLDGTRQRLAAFDGELTVHSPGGGPTLIRMELPCASS